MLGRTHLVFALLLMSFFISFTLNNFLFLLVTLFSVLIPDLDNSSIGIFIKHRGIMHGLLFPLIVGVLLLPIITFQFVKAFWLGYSLHLLGDILTLAGIPLFWPSKSRVRLGLFKSGGNLEKILFYALFAALVVRLYFMVF